LVPADQVSPLRSPQRGSFEGVLTRQGWFVDQAAKHSFSRAERFIALPNR
jgi:hypothetical protein